MHHVKIECENVQKNTKNTKNTFIPQKKITFNPNGVGTDSSHTLKMAIFP